MKRKLFTRRALLFTLSAALLFIPANFYAEPVNSFRQQQPPNISVNGVYSMDKARQGSTMRAAVVMEIPEGYHINSNRPLSKFAVATVLKIEAPRVWRISPVSYPRASVKKFSFSNDPLAVLEGRVIMRFNITVPPNAQTGGMELRAQLRYQSCSNEVCFQPVNKEISLPITVVGANESAQSVNGNIFGGGGGRRRR